MQGGADEPSKVAETIRLAPVEPSQWAALRDLATAVWREHYASVISLAQIEFMLGERFCDAGLASLADQPGHELAILWLGARAVGYCGSGPTDEPGTFKLGQLYLLSDMRGRGLGRRMLEHVEQRARTFGAKRLLLQVNKQNASAIAFYRSQGFGVREAAVFDIGNGFVMDDYVMEKPLGGILPTA